MNSYRRQWFGNILRMQAIIVLVFMLICMFTPLEIIVEYVDQTGRDTLRVVDESMLESLRYAQQTLRFLAKNETLMENLEIYAHQTGSLEPQSLAQIRLRWALLSASYNNPELKVIACITPGTILTNLGVAVIPEAVDYQNRSLGELKAYDQFLEYLEDGGRTDSDQFHILLERVGEETYIAAMLEYQDLYSTAEKGIYACDGAGSMLLADGDPDLNQYVLEHAEELFHSASFGEKNYSYSLTRSLHLVDGRLYIRSEYYALESGMRYIRMQELTEALGMIRRFALQCTVLCMLGETAMAVALWWLTGRVLRPFVQLNEFPSHMAVDAESMERINRLMGSLRKRRGIQRQVLGVYALTLVPLVVMLPVSVNLLGAAVSGAVQSAYIDSVRQTAETLSNRIRLYQRQNTSIAIDESLRELIADAENSTRKENDSRLEALFMAHGLYVRDVLGGVLYDVDGKIIAASRAYDAPEELDSEIMKELSGKYRFSMLATDAYGDDGAVMAYAIRSTQDNWGFSLYEAMGYLVLEAEPIMNFDVDQEAESFYYLYDDEAWQFVETPAYLPFRRVMEGMCQSKMLDVNLDVDSRIVTMGSDMIKQEPGMPGFGERSRQMVLNNVVLRQGPYLPGFAETSRVLVVSARMGGTGLALVGVTSMAPIDEVGRQLPVYLIFTLLIFGVLMLLLGMFFTQKLVRRVRAVERYFESVGLTSYALPEEIDVNNEIGALAQSMHDAIERIDKLQQTIVEEQAQKNHMEVRKREAEVIALQSQMDSHLISNVFATMKLLLHEGEYAALRGVIESTGNFLRSGLTHNEYDVTLDKELRHVEAYLEIQKIRFGDKLRVEWEEYDPALLDCRVPKYLLQPVLENAIKHGMRPKELLTIRIRIGCLKGDLSICVSNDGYGLSDDEIAQLNHRLERREMADHIGLSNVQERIALRYGSPYGLQLSSGEDRLIRVDILLPVNMSEVSKHV